MKTLSVLTWIGNAAAVLGGHHGAVAPRVHQVGCSRQAAYDQARRVEPAVQQAQTNAPTRAALKQELAALRQENQQL